MMPITPPVEIAAWLACLTFVVMLVNGVMKLVDRVKGKPAAGDVAREAADKFTTKTEFRDHAEWNLNEHQNLFSKIGGVERGMNDRLDKKFTDLQESAHEGREKLHKRINRISIGVARLCGRMNVPMPDEDAEI